MSERYTRLYSLPENQYQAGSPLVVSAGALLKDSTTGKVLIQLKFRNISDKTIKSVKVRITSYDTAGTELKGIDCFSYLDLSAGLDDEFGAKTPILLPDTATRSFTVEILSVVYSDGQIYEPSDNKTSDVGTERVLEEMHQRDAEKHQRNKEKLQKTLNYLAFVPLVIALVAIMLSVKVMFMDWVGVRDLTFKGYFRIFHLNIGKFIGQFFSAILIPCVCIAGIKLAKKHKKATVIALAISVFAFCLQFCLLIVYNHNPIVWEQIHKWFGGMRLLLYAREIGRCKYAASGYAVSGFLANLLFFIKNAVAIIVLFIQVRSIKK